MSDRSRKSPTQTKRQAKPRKARAVAKGELLKKARAAVEQYQLIVTSEEGHWYGRGLELPLVFGDGPTVEECIADTREAMVQAVSYLLEQGQPLPSPASVGRRNEQVNVRLTAEEKLLLELSARQKGFSGLSDFIRAAAIEAAR